MFEWLISHAISGLYSLLTKTLLKPMIWSGQQIRCAREEIRAMDIRLHNAQMQAPGIIPNVHFFQHRRKQLWIIGIHTATWLILLCSVGVWFRSAAGPLGAVLIAILVVVGYFNVNVSGMPNRIETERK